MVSSANISTVKMAAELVAHRETTLQYRRSVSSQAWLSITGWTLYETQEGWTCILDAEMDMVAYLLKRALENGPRL